MSPLNLRVGVKSDPIEYRYSYEWLFDLIAPLGIEDVQLGTFFEIYQLPDEYFLNLRAQAQQRGLRISSVFTAHRELGGFFIADRHWQDVARQNFERLIEVGSLLGAKSVGSNPGAVLRDQQQNKQQGIECYLGHMCELMHLAYEKQVDFLAIEPMSCLAEPPTLPQEMNLMAGALHRYHQENPDSTARAGFCFDVSHGYADQEGLVRYHPMDLLEAALPFTHEIHLKNTDAIFSSTFGFGPADRTRGIVDIAQVRNVLLNHANQLPVQELVGYLEIGGPKTGRDYSDLQLESQLRESIAYVVEHFAVDAPASERPSRDVIGWAPPVELSTVNISPSVMCADMAHLGRSIGQLEELGIDWLHVDVMDGRFVPNMPLGLEVVKRLRSMTTMRLDVHLMVEDNDFYINQLVGLGIDQVSCHVESARHLDRTLTLAHKNNMRVGAALNPGTPLCMLDYVLERLDFVLLMTVNPGFAGQKLAPSAWRKIADCRDYLQSHNVTIPIAVDGNVSFANIPKMIACGADYLVAGTSSIYHSEATLDQNLQHARECILQGLRMRHVRSRRTVIEAPRLEAAV